MLFINNLKIAFFIKSEFIFRQNYYKKLKNINIGLKS